jgi:hypothetical protein
MLKNSMISIAVSALLFISGCGGSSSSSTNEETTQTNVENEIMKGTIALGEGAAAHIALIGSNALTVNGTSSDNGFYEINASSLQEPIMVQAILDATGDIMYSFAEANSGIVNVTPLTTYLVDQGATASGIEGGASQLFESFSQGEAPSQLSNNIESASEELDSVIGNVMDANNVSDFNHFSGEFDPNHNGYDAVLDELDISLYNDDVVIREGNITLDTLNYDISVDHINMFGSVKDITTDNLIEDVTLTFKDQEGNTVSTTSDENGLFSVNVETMRIYDVTIAASNYQTQTIPNVSSFIFSDFSLNDIILIPTNADLSANISGNVIDGRTTAHSLSNVTLEFREGYSNRNGDIVATTTTQEDGTFSLENIKVGVYTVAVSLNGYVTKYQEVIAYGDDTENFSLLSNFIENTNAFTTVTLNWNNTPSDLDSHLTGPTTNAEERFHLYYENRIATSLSDLDLQRKMLAQVTGTDYSNATESDLANAYNELSYEDQSKFDELMFNELNPEAAAEQAYFLGLYRDAMHSVTGDDYSELDEENLWNAYSELSGEDQISVDNYIDDETQDYYNGENSTMSETACSNGELASLDRDRTDTFYGLTPETVTICKSDIQGLYKYYVTNYSGDASMASGNAEVTVTTASGVTRTFTAPVPNNSSYSGNVWHVFNIDTNGNIYPVNTMIGQDDYNYDLATSIYSAPSLNQKDSRFTADSKDIFQNLENK